MRRSAIFFSPAARSKRHYDPYLTNGTGSVQPERPTAMTAWLSPDITCKQKTAYEISTRDWSSDVCSSDLTDLKRQEIVDSWPADVDDSAARRDWGHAPIHDLPRAFGEYLFPSIRKRYR